MDDRIKCNRCGLFTVGRLGLCFDCLATKLTQAFISANALTPLPMPDWLIVPLMQRDQERIFARLREQVHEAIPQIGDEQLDQWTDAASDALASFTRDWWKARPIKSDLVPENLVVYCGVTPCCCGCCIPTPSEPPTPPVPTVEEWAKEKDFIAQHYSADYLRRSGRNVEQLQQSLTGEGWESKVDPSGDVWARRRPKNSL